LAALAIGRSRHGRRSPDVAFSHIVEQTQRQPNE
jgi:hypothetical protein